MSAELRFAWKILACTGMRISELLGIETELNEMGMRCIYVAKPERILVRQTQGRRRGKTPQSERFIPIPSWVLGDPLMPVRIDGPLFPRWSAKTLSNDLGDVLWRSGAKTAENGKVTHSLRDRAADRPRAHGVLGEQRDSVLGHNKKTVADGYGTGFPMTQVQPWVEAIWF